VLNKGYTYSETVKRENEGDDLLIYLSSRYRHSTREEWRQRIECGSVLVDASFASPDTNLIAGMEILWRRPPWNEPDVPASYQILFEDAHLLAVSKPSGLQTMPGGRFLDKTLLSLIRQSYPEANPVHRLGRGTSGVVLFSRNRRTSQKLSAGLRERTIEKRYLALISGVPSEDLYKIDVPIGPVPHPALGTVHAAVENGKRAHSQIRILARGRDSSLAGIVILTGRPHQIRIHCAAAGFPLSGDPLYVAGGGIGDNQAIPGDCGYFLHASDISFVHPETADLMTIHANLPDAMEEEIRQKSLSGGLELTF